ncbi:MAG: endonuclease/exonuclease/phosphatase family protein [Bowdeniella nasicola]|nr:endonuclease/exonuclease/phosphatase family protein [Bowdeniella nasicola]
MRLATFNIQHGEAARGGVAHAGVLGRTVTALGEAIADLDIDVVALQEVDRFQARSGSTDQTALIARALRAPHARFAAHTVGSATGLRLRPPRGWGRGLPASGVAIVSRLPVRSWHVATFPLRLPRVTWRGAGDSPFARLRIFDTTRTMLAARIAGPPGVGEIALGCVHAPAAPAVSAEQQRLAVAALATLPGRRILLGDFNARPQELALAWRPLVSGPTFPNPGPHHQIDHIVSESPWRTRASGIESLPFSDHCLAWVDLG